MKEFKGTKGKWLISRCQISEKVRVDSGLFVVAEVYSWDALCGNNDMEETIANALLISKAPEMLEMLERSIREIEHLKHEYRDKGHCGKYLFECENLIKQATEL